MRVRHIAGQDNVDEFGVIRNPALVRHGIINGEQITDLAGTIDPLTHLNRDFPDHQMNECIVAEQLQVGARILCSEESFVTVRIPSASFRHMGRVPVAERRAEWLRTLLRKPWAS